MENEPQYNSITFRGARWLLLFVFYLQFLVPVFMEKLWKWALPNVQMPEPAVMAAMQLFAVFLPCLVFMFLYSAKPGEVMKLNPITKAQALICALIGITAQSTASVLNIPMLVYISSKTGELPKEAIDTPQTLVQLLIGLVVVALLPAIFEELLMRGIVLTSTQNNGYRASLFIGGLYFALLHNQVESIAGHFFLGFLLCYVVWMTQSIYGGMVVHFSFNAFGMLLDYIIKTKSGTYAFLGSGVFQWSVTIVSIFLFFMFVSVINRKRIKRNKSHKLLKQLVFSVVNLPVLLIIMGYMLFQLVRYL